MAQWSKQYSGNTHGTRVQDLEQQLQHAIDVLRSTTAPQVADKSRETVLRMAEMLLAARIRKRKVNAPQKPVATDKKLQRLVDGGVDAVLREFNVLEEMQPGRIRRELVQDDSRFLNDQMFYRPSLC